MIGPLLNAGAIVLGGIVGLARKHALSPAQEAFFKVGLGAFTVFYGLRLTWLSLGPLSHILKQLLVIVLALMIGRILGRLARLQKFSNHLGQQAREKIAAARPGQRQAAGDGFKVCAILFCAAPLGILGALADGLSNYFYTLAVKGVIDGLATMGFVSLFGWSPLLAALPVLAFQATITLLTAQAAGALGPALVESINATGGLLVFCVGMTILDLKKIGLADYLPSLVIAPLLVKLIGVW
jgi:uncharacterized membrane protein YqgA involved in biofilm formation